jgi:DNA-binding NtrC family response regulator
MSRNHRSLRILLVDDDPTIRELFAFHLTHAGHVVIEAASADQAETIWWVDEQSFDLLISDYHMAGKKGDTLVNRFCAVAPWLKCLLVSGHDPSEFRIDAGLHGRVATLKKPVTSQRLLKSIDDLLNRKSEG